ncbi:MAG: leucine-rich repeat domain-containing protein [Ruminococcus sp.]|nr:leucine-rich repeat domain-containing protein [Ruminococcus sp.]
MKKTSALALSAVLAASLVTACGKNSDSSSSGTETTASSTEADAANAAEETTEASSSAPGTTEAQSTDGNDSHGRYEESSYANPNDDASNGDLMAELSMKAESIPPDEDGFRIKDGILYGYDGVENVLYIPDGVTRIESWSFKNDTNIRAVYIPASVTSIGAFVFDCASALQHVSTGNGLVSIGDSSFSRCSSLMDVNLPETLTFIGDSAFWADGDLTIHAPEGCYAAEFAANSNGEIKYSSSPAYYEPVDLASVIRSNQYEYGEFTEFEISADITGIEGEAFEYCKNLKSITVPSNVKYINGSAFEYCDSLETVRIEEGCERIGSYAFSHVPKLKEVWLPASLSNIDKNAFQNYSDGCVFHVPSGSYAEKFMIKYNMNFDNKV